MHIRGLQLGDPSEVCPKQQVQPLRATPLPWQQISTDRSSGDLESLDPSTTTGQVLDLKWSIFQTRASVITVVLQTVRLIGSHVCVSELLNNKSDPCRRSPAAPPGGGEENISSDAEAEQHRERVSSASPWITLETRF